MGGGKSKVVDAAFAPWPGSGVVPAGKLATGGEAASAPAAPAVPARVPRNMLLGSDSATQPAPIPHRSTQPQATHERTLRITCVL